ncbi:SGNH/GDSL hydrolase family protein [Pseudorhodoferax sp.]|jgi:phospholipase/lecithinase/hemolysin|uniref:SGNH/GDSL hydrolase family protein n=1 Tax=Pseudorhodoferax sp. TaxID=1993553 RepID=UPI001B74095B|nr:SGNH/GDSL hydrolase family protein [Pseudorhodoferax sp.]MBP8145262.1 SGNH/GDSL hydrolase family protein [Inhella sp.]
MKTRIALSALALAVLAGCGGGGPEGPAAPSTNETSRVIAFGDSLTDGGAYSRGNSLLLQAPPPQGGGVPAALANQVGKFTNSPGDNWVEVLAKKLGTTIAPERFEMGSLSPVAASNGVNTAANATNYAQGGSRVAQEPGVGCYLPAPAPQTGPCSNQAAVPVKTQIDRAVAKGRFDAKDLVIVWAGANDVFYNATLAGNDITAATIAAGRPLTALETQNIVGKYVIAMETAALNALEQTRRVMANGAQRVVLMTIPNAGQTPFGAQGGASRIGLLTALAGAYNAQLKKELDLSNPGGVLLFDAGALSSAWYTNPTANGFVNKDLPVCGINSFAALPGSSSSFCFITAGPAGTQFNPFASVLPAGVTPENSMFADGVHPSLTAHGKFGNAVYDALKAKAWVK